MTCGCSAIVTVKIDREITENTHRQLTDFPADFHRHIENQQTVYAGLVSCDGGDSTGHGIDYVKARIADEMGVKRIAVASVVIHGWCNLSVEVLWEVESGPHLPGEEKC